MRSSILMALAILSITAVTASAATQPAPIKVGLYVMAKQADGENYPLYGHEISFLAHLSRPSYYDGRVFWNGQDIDPPVPMHFKYKIHVGDTVQICPQNYLLDFSRTKCETHKFVPADVG